MIENHVPKFATTLETYTEKKVTLRTVAQAKVELDGFIATLVVSQRVKLIKHYIDNEQGQKAIRYVELADKMDKALKIDDDLEATFTTQMTHDQIWLLVDACKSAIENLSSQGSASSASTMGSLILLQHRMLSLLMGEIAE